ncbi:hypothetical protein ABLG96_12405 [Nakamurella sp. A5-74]|uniref:MFS transporter n=1 Tax=Nakamurella sp. A5-74 TaxID=3158264 RepID=A0AAU8DLI3_9ACTN
MQSGIGSVHNTLLLQDPERTIVRGPFRPFPRSLAGRKVSLLAALATGAYQVTFMHAIDRLGAALGTSIALGVAPFATGLCA